MRGLKKWQKSALKVKNGMASPTDWVWGKTYDIAAVIVRKEKRDDEVTSRAQSVRQCFVMRKVSDSRRSDHMHDRSPPT
jgi:hypothetical protein